VVQHKPPISGFVAIWFDRASTEYNPKCVQWKRVEPPREPICLSNSSSRSGRIYQSEPARRYTHHRVESTQRRRPKSDKSHPGCASDKLLISCMASTRPRGSGRNLQLCVIACSGRRNLRWKNRSLSVATWPARHTAPSPPAQQSSLVSLSPSPGWTSVAFPRMPSTRISTGTYGASRTRQCSFDRDIWSLLPVAHNQHLRT
jgi:hypothetical protein